MKIQHLEKKAKSRKFSGLIEIIHIFTPENKSEVFNIMKSILFNSIIFFMLTLSVVPCLAQQSGTVTFGYDANGNRCVRQISLLGRNVDMIKGDANPAIGERKPFFDSFEDLSIAVFPNPTKGKIIVSKNDGNGNSLIRAVLTTTAGSVIFDDSFGVQEKVFDLTGFPTGVYLLRISVGRECHVWRVVKE